MRVVMREFLPAGRLSLTATRSGCEIHAGRAVHAENDANLTTVVVLSSPEAPWSGCRVDDN